MAVETGVPWALSPSGRGRRRWAVGRGEKEGGDDGDTAVLTLSHFSRPPFVSFGSVRVGASCTRRLGLENPGAEPAFVAVCRPPPASKGFAVEPLNCLLQPGERGFVSIAWTPLEGGRVRELIIFVVNDVVKHQAILLGSAEQPVKKKRALWETIKRRPTAQQPQYKKRHSNIKHVNKTFQISPKPDRVRSPLQCCENLEESRCSTSPIGDSPIDLENKLCLSPISPILQENQNVTCTPLSLRRSTTYSVLHTVECDELPKGIKETFTVMPMCDYRLEGQLGNAHIVLSKEAQNSNISSLGAPEPLRSLHITSDHMGTLSPHSLPTLECSVPALSPDQFLKENQLAIETASHVCKPVLPSSMESCVSRFPPKKQDEKMLQVGAFSAEPQFPNKAIGATSEGELPAFHSEKCEQNPSFPVHTVKHQMCQFQKQELPKRPLLSSTVIKSKQDPHEGKGRQIQKSKSRKCLSNAIQQCVDKAPESTKLERLPNLPVVESLSGGVKSHSADKASACLESTSHNRKRKSREYLEDIKSGSEEYMDNVDTKKLLMSCELNDKQTYLKTSVPKSAHREKQCQKKRVDVSSRKSRTARKTSKSIVPVAQSQLTFVKPLKTGLPRHPMPFVAKNMFYDERWKEKQQRGFTWWLNFVLTPDDFTVKTDTSHVNAASLILGIESHHKSSVLKAPTKEEVSLRAYSARCKLNKLRRSACNLFISNAMVKAIKKLETEIEAKHLLVRKDRHLWKDIGQRQKILNWLLCYNPLWLRIGLETIYGELIALENNSDVTGLAVFILSRLLWNPDIAAEYRHPTVPHLYRDGHEEVLSKFTLKKLLLLVCFLDHAKSSRIIDHDPCLFCKNAEFKSSREILLAFSRDFLSGEGDLSRHLGFLGLPVNHVQTPLDEFDFAVVNLATDLQCGIRLVRTLELLSKNWCLSKKLRVPAISRLQKMHNVNIALQVLKDHGIQLKDEYGSGIDAKDIVDRHREKTLALLWKIVFTFQVNVFLDLHQLKAEIDFLKNKYDTQVKMAALESSVTPKVRKVSSSFYSSENGSENVKLLMDWVNAVCVFYGIQVENFTVSFSDGRVLCYLIHHYHPYYVPLEAIRQRTTQTVECTKSGTLALSFSSESDDSLNLLNGTFGQAVTTSALYKELLDNEKKNFQLINAAVSDLGGVPAMIHHGDMSNTIPDEKMVITYVSFLCSRLLDLCKEIRAARHIQSAWREHKLKQKLAQNIKQTLNATVVIQKHWRRYLAQRELQKLKKAKREEAERVSSIVIQTYWRGYCARRKYLMLRYNTVLMQARIRMLLSLAAYRKVCWAAVTIQRHWRASLRARNDYQSYQHLKRSAFVIQSAFRKWKGCKIKQKMKAEMLLQETELAKKARAAGLIQSRYRMIRDRSSYLHVRQSVIKIQAWFRCIQAKFGYKQKKAGVLAIEKYYGAYRLGRTERKAYLQKRAAVVVLQSALRRMKTRLLFRQVRAVCIIQSFWRMRRERQRFLHLKHSVIVLQSHVRKQQQLKRYRAMKDAASVIQARYRAYVDSKKAITSYKNLRHAAVILQSAFRARQVRLKFSRLKSVIKIQSCFRAYIARKRFLNLKFAAVKIQAFIKMRQARNHYCALRETAIWVQRRYRSQKHTFQLQEEYAKLRRACIKVQAVVRGNHARKWVKRWQEAAIVLQAQYRMKRQRQHYLSMCRASAVIQMHYRAYRARTHQRQILNLKKATVCLQAAWRGYRLRKTLQLENEAAVMIQAAFRAHVARMKYQAMGRASLVIQRWYRASKTTSKIRESFLRTKAAIITLQAASRGWLVRKRIQEQQAAVTVIQSAFRKYKALKKFTMTRNAALTLQRHYRAIILGREQQHAYLLLRTCVIQLQAAWRGNVVRKQIKRQHQCAVVIQAYYKMHINQAKFKRLRLATISIQRWYRAVVLAKRQRQEYLALKEAAVKIQAFYRGVRTRQKVQQMHCAAVCIQAMFKMHQVYARYQAMKLATAVIQARYRAVCRRRQERAKYLELREASLILQSAYRGMKVRQELKILHQSAASIQSFYRMYKQRKCFQKSIAAAKLIQQWYRGCKDRNVRVHKFKQLKIAALQIQSAFRGMRERRQLKKMHVAAATIQRRFRTFLQQQSFVAVRAAAVTIQRKYRATVLAKQQHSEYLHLCKSVIIMQSAFRGMLARQRVKQMHVAATIIQANFRMHIAHNCYKAMKLASVIIQQRYRAYREAKNMRELFLKQRHSALILQAAYRGMKMRCIFKKQLIAATVIQSHFRMHRQRRSYQKAQWAARVIQTRFRASQLSRIARQQYSSEERAATSLQMASCKMEAKQQRRRHAAVVLQRSFRMWRDHQQFLAYQAAAIVLQRRYRALILSRRQAQEYLCLRRAVICIQSFYRGFKIRRQVWHMYSAAKVTQAAFRMHQERFSYQRQQHAATIIQNYYRAYLKGKHQRKEYLEIWKAAVVIQASYRGLRVRQEQRAMHVSASVIQSLYRMHVQRKCYKRLCWAVITIQSAYRGMVARRRAKELHVTWKTQPCFHIAMDGKLIQYKTAAITLQTWYRANKARVQYQEYRKAAIVIQQYFRSYLAMQRQRRVYLQTLRCIIVIQATVRGFLERQRVSRIKRSAMKMQVLEQKQQSSVLRFTAFAYQHLAAVRIQRAYRIYLLRKHEHMRLASVLYIQRWYRAKVQRRKFLQYREKTVKIQRMVRKWMKCKNASSGKMQIGMSPKTLNNGITKFQALWRGYSWRKKTDTDETRALRDSLVIANKESKEEMKLCNRTAVAIDHLLKYKHFSYILAALKDLEVVTRLSPVCCESMAQTKAVSTIFTLIRSCNRSVPSMDVIRYSVQILLNLSKYERTTQAVYAVENSISTLLDLLQMYRERAGDKISEKDGSIFTKTCCLLALLSKDSTRAFEIQSNPQVIARLRSLFKLTSRKHQMDAQRILAKEKTSAFRNGRCFVPVKQRTKIVSRQRPDWVLRKDNMQEIVDPLQAIQMVMDTLGISYY